ncbi:tyrosine recombinase XerD [Pseudomonas aeruginosa]|nr:tyrosine recombinase XerD [Pseudomonas aeruginosa]
MSTRTDRVILTRAGCHWHLTDASGSTCWPCLDYLIDCVDRQRLKAQTVELRAYALKAWLRHLNDHSLRLEDATDFDLVSFSQDNAERKSRRAFGDAQARRRSTNQIVRCVYLFCAWLSNSSYNRSAAFFGPANCQITSTINVPGRHRGRTNYPATYRFAGERSKHQQRYVPSEDDRRRLVAHFYNSYSDSIAQRNALILDLALSVGWRRGSILSLKVDQFVRSSQCLDGSSVSPPEQKFGYTKAFSVDGTLMSRVAAYIAGHRAMLIERTGGTSERLFLSDKTGEPLTPAAVTKIFARARTALGLPVGVGLHAWRRAFAVRTMSSELEKRKRLGLNLPFTDIAAVVANRLGHESLHSQEAYIRGHGVSQIMSWEDE